MKKQKKKRYLCVLQAAAAFLLLPYPSITVSTLDCIIKITAAAPEDHDVYAKQRNPPRKASVCRLLQIQDKMRLHRIDGNVPSLSWSGDEVRPS